ncbi:MAG: hypothetical protein RLZZ244_1327 [Verrucomicrobiota bacterium]|jgi:hypothetical protein
MTPERLHLWDLFTAYAEGTLDAPRHAELELALQSDPEARRLWFLYQDLELGLRTQLQSRPPSVSSLSSLDPSPASPGRLKSRLAAAVAAGIAFGAVGTSALFATIGPLATRVTHLLRESFESGPAPLRSGMPLRPGVWAGDGTEVCGPFAEIQPASGGKMLRFLSAQYEGGPQKIGYNSDMHRIIDLADHAKALSEGKGWITVQASFRAAAHTPAGRYLCGIELRALSELPSEGGENAMWRRIFADQRATLDAAGIPQNSSRRETALSPNAPQWTRLRNDLPLPPGTRYVLVTLHAMDAQAAAHKAPAEEVQFPGHFLDDIQVSLSLGQPLP